VGNRIVFADAGLERGLADRRADILIANIQADILQIYAADLLRAVAPGGTLILSGILATELDAVAKHFANEAHRLNRPSEPPRQDVDGEWSALALDLP
jgi:ribosomal protein L11 methyltransferase